MYEYNQVINGVVKYIDDEILVKISDWRKWIFGGAIGIILSKGTDVFNNLKNNEFIKILEIIDKDDMINIDKIYEELKKQSKKNSITFNAPMLGVITLNEKDVDKIYESIKSIK